MERPNSLLGAIDFWGEKSPSKTAMTFLDDAGTETNSLTYSHLLNRSRALASHLVNSVGLSKGKPCLLVYPPSLEFTVAYLACLTAGVIAVPCFPPDPRKLKKDLHMFTAIQGSSGATVALTSRSYNYAKKMGDIKSIFTGGSSWPEMNWVVTDALSLETEAAQAGQVFPAPDPSDVAFLQYTSGSTSEPKGVMITHANLAHNLKLIVTGLSAIEDTVVVGWLPQYHDMGLIGSVLALLFCGGSGYYMSPVTFIKRPPLWMELISRYRGTHMQAPNFAYGLTARKFMAMEHQPQLDLSCVRHMINAAEPVDAASIDRFYAVFESHGLKRGVIFPTYGLAEHTVYVCSNGRDRLVIDRIMFETDWKIRPVENKLEMWAYGVDGAGTLGGRDDGVLTTSVVGCGHPSDNDGVDLRIVDTETRKTLPEGSVGEVWVTSKSRAAGYWSRPEKTKEDFGGRLADTIEPDGGLLGPGGTAAPEGYLRTGDLGFLWKGELYICGRIKDLIIVRGRNHYPQDIERSAEAAVAGALRGGCSSAFGVTNPQGAETMTIVAEVQQAAGLDGEALVTAIRRCVATDHGVSLATVRLLRPRTIPKTTSGKIARTMCKRAHTAGSLDTDTLFLWGETSATPAAMDARAEKDELPDDVGGVEEAKASWGTEGDAPRGDPREMAESEILAGVRSEVARILKAQASAIPTDAPLSTLGLDSMEAMQLMALLEERFSVKLPEEVMLEEDTTLASLAPIIKAGGAVPERATGIDCGKLAELEFKEGPPKDYMAKEAVENKQTMRLAESSFKTNLETGKFRPGCLSEQAKMSAVDLTLTRAFCILLSVIDFTIPTFFMWQVFDSLRSLASGDVSLGNVALRLGLLVLVFVALPMALSSLLGSFPPVGVFSRLRACVVKYVGLRLVVEGKNDHGKTCVYVGVGLGTVEQLLLASVAPSALSRPVRPTFSAHPVLASPGRMTLQALLGSGRGGDPMQQLEAALKKSESASTEARNATAAALAPTVAFAMRHGAQIVPCAVLGGGRGVEGRFVLATASAALGLGPRPGGVAIVCAPPVRVPFTGSPTQALVMEFAETARAAAAKALAEHSEAFLGSKKY